MKQVRYKLRCNYCACVQIFPPMTQSAQKSRWIDKHLDTTRIHCVGNTELLCPPHHEIVSRENKDEIIFGSQHFTVEEILEG